MVPRALIAGVVIALVTTAATPPAEAKASKAEEKFLEAVQAHKAGKAKKAIKALKAALKADPHPTLLYNLGVLSDAAGDAKGAGGYYAKYLDTNPEDASVVLLRYQQIAPKEAEAWAKAREAPKTKKKDGKALAKKDGKAGKGEGGGDKGGAAGGGSNVLSYSLLGAGGVALAIGAVFGAMTVSDVNEFMDSRVRSEAQRHADDAKSHQLMANISYITGLLALGGGVAMLMMSGGDDGEPSSAKGAGGDVPHPTTPALTPLVGPDAAGGMLTFEF